MSAIVTTHLLIRLIYLCRLWLSDRTIHMAFDLLTYGAAGGSSHDATTQTTLSRRRDYNAAVIASCNDSGK